MTDFDRWLGEVCDELGVEPEVLQSASTPLLELVRDIAHGVSRPAGPLTVFLVGLAAGAGAPADRTGQQVAETTERVRQLLEEFAPSPHQP